MQPSGIRIPEAGAIGSCKQTNVDFLSATKAVSDLTTETSHQPLRAN